MNNKKTIGIIGAMDSEIAMFSKKLHNIQTVNKSGLTFFIGVIGEYKGVIVKSGVGKVNAALCTQILIDQFTPDYIVNTGIAGGIASGLSIGDVIIGIEFVQHDFDVTAFGHAKGYLCNDENPAQPTVFHADARLVYALENAAIRKLSSAHIRKGRIATGDIFVSSTERKREIRKEFNALAAEMEGAAIAQTAVINSIPFAAVRVVSDLANGEAADSYDLFEKKAADLSAFVIENLLKKGEI